MSALLLAGLLALLVSAFFSLAETSFLSLSRAQLARLDKARPGRLSFWAEDPDRALAVILLANNLVNVGMGFLATAAALEAERSWGLPLKWGGLLFPGGAAALVIIFGEIIPKILARFASERIALFLSPAFRGITAAGAPFVGGLVRGTSAFLERLSDKVRAEGSWDPHLIRQMLQDTPLHRDARRVLSGLLDFDRRTVWEEMIPREEIYAVDLRSPKAPLIAEMLKAGYSRVPVHRGDLDRAEGVIYLKDLVAAARENDLIVLEDLVRPVQRVEGTAPLPVVLRMFREGRQHMALVTDREGRVAGLVTLQDLLEAIVGPVAEEPSLLPVALTAAEVRSLVSAKAWRELQSRAAISQGALAPLWPVLAPFEKVLLFRLLSPAAAEALFVLLPRPDRVLLMGALDPGALGPVREDLGAEETDRIFPRWSEDDVRRLFSRAGE